MPDDIRLLGWPKIDHRRYRSHLEARQHKEFLAICTTARDVAGRLENDLRGPGIWSGQTDRLADIRS